MVAYFQSQGVEWFWCCPGIKSGYRCEFLFLFFFIPQSLAGYELRWYVSEEAGALSCRAVAEQVLAVGVQQIDPLLCPGYTYQAQASFLLQLIRVFQRPSVWQQALFHTDDKNPGK